MKKKIFHGGLNVRLEDCVEAERTVKVCILLEEVPFQGSLPSLPEGEKEGNTYL